MLILLCSRSKYKMRSRDIASVHLSHCDHEVKFTTYPDLEITPPMQLVKTTWVKYSILKWVITTKLLKLFWNIQVRSCHFVMEATGVYNVRLAFFFMAKTAL
jgi:hypothetical protein